LEKETITVLLQKRNPGLPSVAFESMLLTANKNQGPEINLKLTKATQSSNVIIIVT
jgi:hypothetical protein